MTRRLTLTMVAVVTGALLTATTATLFVTRLEARTQSRRELGRQAQRLARRIETVQRGGLAGVQVALRLEAGAVACFGPSCRTPGNLPAGLTQRDIRLDRLRNGRVVTGSRGPLTFAAAPAPQGENLTVVVLTHRNTSTRQALGPSYFVLSATILLIAAAVAANLGRRLARPLREAQSAARRIATGDLAARVPEHRGDDEDLAELARSINAMAASLERSRSLERQFLMSVSHDLRTPLTSIRGFAEALAEGKATDPGHAASVIIAEARRLERLVGDLLELAKLGARRFSLDIRATDVAEVASDTAEGFRPAADAAAVSLDVRGAPGLTAAADPDRLAQVLANLTENALKFATSSISIGAGHDAGGQVTVWVEDDGPGITAEERPHVFEPFWSSSRTPTRQVGSGLGLAIVAELVDAMGGSVRAEAAAAGGSRMVVGLRPWRGAEAHDGRG